MKFFIPPMRTTLHRIIPQNNVHHLMNGQRSTNLEIRNPPILVPDLVITRGRDTPGPHELGTNHLHGIIKFLTLFLF